MRRRNECVSNISEGGEIQKIADPLSAAILAQSAAAERRSSHEGADGRYANKSGRHDSDPAEKVNDAAQRQDRNRRNAKSKGTRPSAKRRGRERAIARSRGGADATNCTVPGRRLGPASASRERQRRKGAIRTTWETNAV